MPRYGCHAEPTNSGRRGRRPHALATDDVAQGVPFVMDGIAELDIEGLNLDGGDMYGYPPIAQRAPFVIATNPVPAPAPAPAPAPRRTMLVVILYEIPPQNGQFGAEGRRFHLDRDTLFTLLPRTRLAVRRGALDLRSFFLPEDMESHPPSIIHRALHFLFSHLEEHSRTGTLDMFGTAEQQIEHGSVRTSVVKRWAAMVHALCVVLNNDNGLGCSEGLLGHILNFFELLIQDIHNLIGWDETTILFEAFAGVFRTERRDLTSQLNRIWDSFDPEVQEQLLRDMRRALPAEGIDGMAHRMYRALGY
ncbi:hypothetical protein MRS44_009140 [Fusarium solani]|uniref:Uncharacterized protein n=1 Tax=Fusarium solani TaxID=169388 RepID=A0A9P9HP19_FUSSL|nr:uncharacterized protein B0J15DRAFT_287380 [Fusarium solani]KAH7260513.1 hypothetical protein B0J15DRAFT_287380 [Fusarium solani]KAJ3464354.1 hypothetical protein MRS44_009140 [Fusarium solani]